MENYTEPAIIGKISQLLRLKLPTDAENLRIHLTELGALQYEVALATVDTQKLLYEKRKQLLWPKEKDQTELDRKTKLDADTAPVQRNYELLIRIESLVDQRLQLCSQLLQ